METGRIQLKTFLWAVFSVLFLEIAASSLNIPFSYRYSFIGAIRILDIFLLLWVIRHHEKRMDVLGIDFSRFWIGIKKGCLWSAGFALAALLAGYVLFLSGHNPIKLIHSQLPETTFSAVIFFLVAGIIGPVAEEIFFRGFIFGFFRRMGFWFALFFSALIFTSLHTNATGIPLPQLVGGIVFAAAFEIEKNLFVPITIHIFGNLAIFSFSLISI